MMIERVRTHCQLWCIQRSNIHVILNYLKLTWTLFLIISNSCHA